jgi:hypothetical protein
VGSVPFSFIAMAAPANPLSSAGSAKKTRQVYQYMKIFLISLLLAATGPTTVHAESP